MAIPVNVKVDRATTMNIIILVSSIVAIIAVLVIVWNVRKSIAKKIRDKNAALKVINLQNEIETIAESAGVSTADVARAKNIADNVAKALGVHINTPWYASITENEALAVQHLNRIESEEEATLVADFYVNDVTEGRNLKADINRYLSKGWRSDIEFYTSIN